MKKLVGFTILETLISLIIMCGLLTIGTFYLKDYQADIILENTVKETMTALEQGSRVSLLNDEETNITYFAKSSRVVISSDHFKRNIDIDKSIRIKNLSQFGISRKGTIRPRTLYFTNGKKDKKVRIQMTWGKMLYED